MAVKQGAISPSARVVDLLRAYRVTWGCGEALERYLEDDAWLIGGLFRHRACAAIRKASSRAEQEFITRLQVRAVELVLTGIDKQTRLMSLIAYSTELRMGQAQSQARGGPFVPNPVRISRVCGR